MGTSQSVCSALASYLHQRNIDNIPVFQASLHVYENPQGNWGKGTPKRLLLLLCQNSIHTGFSSLPFQLAWPPLWIAFVSIGISPFCDLPSKRPCRGPRDESSATGLGCLTVILAPVRSCARPSHVQNGLASGQNKSHGDAHLYRPSCDNVIDNCEIKGIMQGQISE